MTRPGTTWLLVAAGLNAAIAAATDYGASDRGPSLFHCLLSLFLLWRISRGGHVAWVLSVSGSTVGAGLFSWAAVNPAGVESADELAVLYTGLTVVLLSRPVRRLVDRTAERPAEHASAGQAVAPRSTARGRVGWTVRRGALFTPGSTAES